MARPLDDRDSPYAPDPVVARGPSAGRRPSRLSVRAQWKAQGPWKRTALLRSLIESGAVPRSGTEVSLRLAEWTGEADLDLLLRYHGMAVRSMAGGEPDVGLPGALMDTMPLVLAERLWAEAVRARPTLLRRSEWMRQVGRVAQASGAPFASLVPDATRATSTDAFWFGALTALALAGDLAVNAEGVYAWTPRPERTALGDGLRAFLAIEREASPSRTIRFQCPTLGAAFRTQGVPVRDAELKRRVVSRATPPWTGYSAWPGALQEPLLAGMLEARGRALYEGGGDDAPGEATVSATGAPGVLATVTGLAETVLAPWDGISWPARENRSTVNGARQLRQLELAIRGQGAVTSVADALSEALDRADDSRVGIAPMAAHKLESTFVYPNIVLAILGGIPEASAAMSLARPGPLGPTARDLARALPSMPREFFQAGTVGSDTMAFQGPGVLGRVGQALQYLKTEGLVERRRQGAAHGFVLTPKGRALVEGALDNPSVPPGFEHQAFIRGHIGEPVHFVTLAPGLPLPIRAGEVGQGHLIRDFVAQLRRDYPGARVIFGDDLKQTTRRFLRDAGIALGEETPDLAVLVPDAEGEVLLLVEAIGAESQTGVSNPVTTRRAGDLRAGLRDRHDRRHAFLTITRDRALLERERIVGEVWVPKERRAISIGVSRATKTPRRTSSGKLTP